MEYPLTIKDVDLSVALQLPTRQVTSQGGQLLSVTWPPDSPSSSASSDALGEENCNIFLELNDELNKVLFDSFTPPAINRSAPIGMQHANSNEKAVVISNTRGYKRKNPNTTKLPPPKMSSATRHMGFIGDDEGNDGNLAAECGETTQSNVPQFSNNKDPLADQQCKTAAKPGNSSSTSSSMSAWQVEDLADNLAELDGSLSGLGVDLSATPYSMSEALLSLPSLTVFKQEAPSPTNGDNVPGNTANDNNANKNLNSATSLHQLLQQHSTNFGIPTMPVPSSHLESTAVSTMVSSHSGGLGSTMTVSSVATSSTDMVQQRETPMDCRFQYVLAAATSIATKVNEETLTYLNQGQPYEIKLKKLGELSAYRGKILKSVIRICFHERRLQYMEREQMAAWQASRPGDRIVELDVPLSYGVFDVVQDPNSLNTVEFLWDPTKEVGAYIKVNCISTEFTPKKHGGEKGVPFRIQVETYLQSDETSKRLHVAACQIKVFKLKGADRKHKQDREKILKRPMIEQDKFQPSYECTVLNDVPVENPFQSAAASPVAASPNNCIFNSVESSQPRGNNVAVVPVTVMTPKEEPVIAPPSNVVAVPSPVSNCSSIIPDQSPDSPLPVYQQQPLQNEATAQQTVQWLQANRFGQYIRTFISFSGADLLRLSRDDLIQICGLADGIRLFNALHSKTVVPRLTLYLCVQQGAVYHAMYLSTLTRNEMVSKLAQLMGVSREQIRDIYLQGPGGIHILVTDDVVNNIRDEAMFSIEILPADQSGERYRLLLKSVTH